ncbi:pilus assembly protein [Sphingobium baderi]|uniref:pilus assembly protein n=1 Tax=Sphingobium baderi TaxID=1332080 RepID=UPI002B409C89|nr:TadE/TadG family type IV pilus assembly protein [Sphingobium baderi]WRD77007.1 pilus assembly protein TadG-related protein [Sphingobium baderi]
MSEKAVKSTGFLGRLRRDASGNTLAIVAAAIFPLAAMIGGGIDISRLYLTKTRLQQACDAGALAGRKAMSGITWTDANNIVAEQFFHMNFPDGRYGTGTTAIDYSASNTGAVTGTASVVVPMTLMSLFNLPDKTIHAECTADLQLPNTDVMFVLDTTLSMNDANPGDSQSRIAVLREAVSNFYTELQRVKPAGSHIRYGFVPYSSTVNVGMLLKRDWIQDNAVYDSREADGTSPKEGGIQGPTINNNDPFTTVPPGPKYQGPSEKCVAPASTLKDTSEYSAWTPSKDAVPRERTRTRTRNGTSYSVSLSNGICWITPTTYNNLVETGKERVIPNPNAGQENADSLYYHWIYKPISYPMASLKGSGDGNATVSGGTLTPTPVVANGHKPRTVTWNQTNGCIEERKTRRTDEGSDVPRYDMDVDLVPDKNNRDTQWKPYLPGLVHGRRNTSFTSTTNWNYTEDSPTKTREININAQNDYLTPSSSPQEYGACPTYARKLAEINDASTLTTYLNALKPAGFTYHDIGFLWGLRLMSRDGIFKEENRAAEATGKVARNLIFMTDGETDPRIGAYDAWGLSAMDRRRTPIGAIPTNDQHKQITEARLTELCTLAKNDKNITVWVIAFGTDLTSLLTNCASSGRAYQANNAAELTATFSQIASQIAQLRITK